MIRFIDIGKQVWLDESDPECPRQFAWYNTTTDTFMSFGGDQVFDSWDEFQKCHFAEYGDEKPYKAHHIPLSRFHGLCHSWVFGADS